ncbi:hypothetical protein Lalb_Chr05g0226871 [Lupinus albus]|uniref:Uncharacterized protein n=1 Tax=Lupinus albus TaxID=3870 RepID=A0A6A4QLD7_LUPAL|nr:hypothetical protein Lalb_Chr11g0071191 [Lupinus albus]KAE9614339.1 hypothetical protein Lalb_Chr05g0226871 [Lupinus albus]
MLETIGIEIDSGRPYKVLMCIALCDAADSMLPKPCNLQLLCCLSCPLVTCISVHVPSERMFM